MPVTRDSSKNLTDEQWQALDAQLQAAGAGLCKGTVGFPTDPTKVYLNVLYQTFFWEFDTPEDAFAWMDAKKAVDSWVWYDGIGAFRVPRPGETPDAFGGQLISVHRAGHFPQPEPKPYKTYPYPTPRFAKGDLVRLTGGPPERPSGWPYSNHAGDVVRLIATSHDLHPSTYLAPPFVSWQVENVQTGSVYAWEDESNMELVEAHSPVPS